MVLICISFVHVTILDIWLILSGFVKVLMMPAISTVRIRTNKWIWKKNSMYIQGTYEDKIQNYNFLTINS